MAQPARPLRADAARNRARVLETAYETFAAEGLSVPIDEIARRAGLGVGTLYRHFPTKEALFAAIVVTRMEDVVVAARSLLNADAPGEAFFGFLAQLTEGWAAKKDLVDALASAGAGISSGLAETGTRLRGDIGHLLARAQRGGAIRDDIGIADLMALVAGVLFALQTRSAELADPRRAVAVLSDGLLAARVRAH